MDWTPAQRNAAFLVGCMGTRLALTNVARTRPDLLPTMGRLAVIPAVGFAAIWLLKLRPTGMEVQGQPIWWDSLRPLHAALWGVFAHQAMAGNRDAWKVLLADTAIGGAAWYNHRFLQ
jgi:hypothetical protein